MKPKPIELNSTLSTQEDGGSDYCEREQHSHHPKASSTPTRRSASGDNDASTDCVSSSSDWLTKTATSDGFSIYSPSSCVNTSENEERTAMQNICNKRNEKLRKPCKDGFCYCFTSDSDSLKPSSKPKHKPKYHREQQVVIIPQKTSSGKNIPCHGIDKDATLRAQQHERHRTRTHKSSLAPCDKKYTKRQGNVQIKVLTCDGKKPSHKNCRVVETIKGRHRQDETASNCTDSDAPLIHIVQKIRKDLVISEVRVKRRKGHKTVRSTSAERIHQNHSPPGRSESLESFSTALTSFDREYENTTMEQDSFNGSSSTATDEISFDSLSDKPKRSHPKGGALLLKRTGTTAFSSLGRAGEPPKKPPRNFQSGSEQSFHSDSLVHCKQGKIGGGDERAYLSEGRAVIGRQRRITTGVEREPEPVKEPIIIRTRRSLDPNAGYSEPRGFDAPTVRTRRSTDIDRVTSSAVVREQYYDGADVQPRVTSKNRRSFDDPHQKEKPRSRKTTETKDDYYNGGPVIEMTRPSLSPQTSTSSSSTYPKTTTSSDFVVRQNNGPRQEATSSKPSTTDNSSGHKKTDQKQNSFDRPLSKKQKSPAPQSNDFHTPITKAISSGLSDREVFTPTCPPMSEMDESKIIITPAVKQQQKLWPDLEKELNDEHLKSGELGWSKIAPEIIEMLHCKTDEHGDKFVAQNKRAEPQTAALPIGFVLQPKQQLVGFQAAPVTPDFVVPHKLDIDTVDSTPTKDKQQFINKQPVNPAITTSFLAHEGASHIAASQHHQAAPVIISGPQASEVAAFLSHEIVQSTTQPTNEKQSSHTPASIPKVARTVPILPNAKPSIPLTGATSMRPQTAAPETRNEEFDNFAANMQSKSTPVKAAVVSPKHNLSAAGTIVKERQPPPKVPNRKDAATIPQVLKHEDISPHILDSNRERTHADITRALEAAHAAEETRQFLAAEATQKNKSNQPIVPKTAPKVHRIVEYTKIETISDKPLPKPSPNVPETVHVALRTDEVIPAISSPLNDFHKAEHMKSQSELYSQPSTSSKRALLVQNIPVHEDNQTSERQRHSPKNLQSSDIQSRPLPIPTLALPQTLEYYDIPSTSKTHPPEMTRALLVKQSEMDPVNLNVDKPQKSHHKCHNKHCEECKRLNRSSFHKRALKGTKTFFESSKSKFFNIKKKKPPNVSATADSDHTNDRDRVQRFTVPVQPSRVLTPVQEVDTTGSEHHPRGRKLEFTLEQNFPDESFFTAGEDSFATAMGGSMTEATRAMGPEKPPRQQQPVKLHSIDNFDFNRVIDSPKSDHILQKKVFSPIKHLKRSDVNPAQNENPESYKSYASELNEDVALTMNDLLGNIRDRLEPSKDSPNTSHSPQSPVEIMPPLRSFSPDAGRTSSPFPLTAYKKSLPNVPYMPTPPAEGPIKSPKTPKYPPSTGELIEEPVYAEIIEHKTVAPQDVSIHTAKTPQNSPPVSSPNLALVPYIEDPHALYARIQKPSSILPKSRSLNNLTQQNQQQNNNTSLIVRRPSLNKSTLSSESDIFLENLFTPKKVFNQPLLAITAPESPCTNQQLIKSTKRRPAPPPPPPPHRSPQGKLPSPPHPHRNNSDSDSDSLTSSSKLNKQKSVSVDNLLLGLPDPLSEDFINIKVALNLKLNFQGELKEITDVNGKPMLSIDHREKFDANGKRTSSKNPDGYHDIKLNIENLKMNRQQQPLQRMVKSDGEKDSSDGSSSQLSKSINLDLMKNFDYDAVDLHFRSTKAGLLLPFAGSKPIQTSTEPNSVRTATSEISCNTSFITARDDDSSPVPQNSKSLNSTLQSVKNNFKNRLRTSFRKGKDYLKHETRRISGVFDKTAIRDDDAAGLAAGHSKRQSRDTEEYAMTLLNEISSQDCLKRQITQAVNICRKMPDLENSSELVEAERLLLYTTLKEDAAKKELIKLDDPEIGGIAPNFAGLGGGLVIKNFQIPVKSDPSYDNFFNYFYIGVFAAGTEIKSTYSEEKRSSVVYFRDCNISFENLDSNFEIHVDIYALRLRKISNLSKSKEQKGAVNKKSSSSSLDSSDEVVSRFKLHGYFILKPLDLSPFSIKDGHPLAEFHLRESFCLRSETICVLPIKLISRNTNLCDETTLNACAELQFNNFGLRGFLDVENSGGGHRINWNKRWCQLDAVTLFFWNYPQDCTEEKTQIFQIDLSECVSYPIGPADRSVCSRPRSFSIQICSSRDCTDIETYLFATDSQTEYDYWTNYLNEVVKFTRTWKL